MSEAVWPDLSAQIELISVADAAAVLGVTVTRVSQYLRDGTLVGLRRPGESPLVPADLLQGAAVVKGLPGTITLLRDAGYRGPRDRGLAVPRRRLAARNADPGLA